MPNVSVHPMRLWLTRSVGTMLLAASAALVGCANQNSGDQSSLYHQLGGNAGITTVVHTFIGIVSADKRINARFAHANIPQLESQLVAQLGQETGGPEVYTGPDMYQAHKGMNITDAEWNAFMQDFALALKKDKVPELAQARLISLLEPQKSEIVGH